MVDEVHTYLSAFNRSPFHFWMFIFWILLWRGFIRHLILHILKMGCHFSAFTIWLSLWLINQDAQTSILGVISDSSFSHTRDSQFTKSSQVNFLSLYISVSYCHHLTPGQHNFLPGICIVNSPSIYYTQSSEMHSYLGYSMPQTFREASHCAWKWSTWYYLKALHDLVHADLQVSLTYIICNKSIYIFFKSKVADLFQFSDIF